MPTWRHVSHSRASRPARDGPTGRPSALAAEQAPTSRQVAASALRPAVGSNAAGREADDPHHALSESPRLTAVDRDARTHDPRRTRGDEKRHHIRNLVDRPKPLPRDLALDELADRDRVVALPPIPA